MPAWALEFYADERGREPCREWMERDLSDVQYDALVEALRLVLAERGPDVCRTEWGKALGEGLYEFRVRHTAKELSAMFGGTPPGGKAGERVLLRVFFHAYGKRVVLLLGGYHKGKDPSERRQHREIATARKRLDHFKARRAAERRTRRKTLRPGLTGYGEFPILVEREAWMGSKFDDYVRTSKRTNTKESRERRAVFGRAYTIAMQLVTLREKRGLTQTEVAERSGVPQSEISRIERGSVRPTERTLVRLADALDAVLVLVERDRRAVAG